MRITAIPTGRVTLHYWIGLWNVVELSNMYFDMTIEMRLVTESPFTKDTLVGFLSRMTSHVDFQMFFYRKRTRAFRTLEGSLACMCPYVSREINSMSECHWAMNALVGPLPRMDPRVLGERALEREAFPAFGFRADEGRRRPGMHEQMFI